MSRQTVTRPAQSAEVPTRTRAIKAPMSVENPRAAVGNNSASLVTKEMKDLAAEYYLANAISNAAKAKADKARKALFKAMKQAGAPNFEHTFKDGETKHIVDVTVDTPETTYIDVDVLKTLVKSDVFAKCISASKTAVTEHAGTSIALQAEKTKPGTENVNVKVRK